MVDSIQRGNTVPVPPYQTNQGSQNPLPVNSPNEIARVNGNVVQGTQQQQQDGFEDYLNNTSITTLEKSQQKPTYDPVSDVVASSTYSQPNDKTQF